MTHCGAFCSCQRELWASRQPAGLQPGGMAPASLRSRYFFVKSVIVLGSCPRPPATHPATPGPLQARMLAYQEDMTKTVLGKAERLETKGWRDY